MNIFLKPEIAAGYDNYYSSCFGRKVDIIEKKIIDKFLKKIPRTKLIELGCGTGHWTDYLIKQGFKVYGIDISEAMLNVAKNKKIKADFLLTNSENLPFKDESFKVAISITMLEFVDNQNKAIQEIYRILDKNGWLIIGCLNSKSVIGKNKENDEIFKTANLLSIDDIKTKFEQFIIHDIKYGVFLNSDYSIMDYTNNINNIEPVFIGILLQKK